MLKSSDPGFNADADLNYDGIINNADSDILSESWLTSGAPTEEKYYCHYDGLGSIIALSNSAGDTIETHAHDVLQGDEYNEGIQ